MFRIAVVFLLLLLINTSIGARDYRRSRRDPSSAMPPPVDYQAIRTRVLGEVRPRIEAWLLARTGILAPCDRCGGAGLLPGSTGNCAVCPEAGGVVRHPAFDPAEVDRFHLRGLGERWDSLNSRPHSFREIAINSFTIDEIRVLGRGQVQAFVRTRRIGESGECRHPDVSLWIRSGGAWLVRDPFSGPPPRNYPGGGRFPSGVRDEPRHEEGTKESLWSMRRFLRSGLSHRSGRIELIVRCESPGTWRKAVFLAEGRVGEAFKLQRMHLPLREGKCGDVETAERLVASLVGDVLGGSLLPEPREYHLTRKGPAILATGFSPRRYLREVTVVADHEGRPVSIRESGPDGSSSTSLRYVRKGSQWLISGWIRESKTGRETCEVRWRRGARGWLPAQATIGRPEGEYRITLSTR